jgi:hypothetical protein
MKTKNVIIGSGVVLGGVALYFLFFRKNKNSQGVSSVNTGNASTGLLPIGSGGISKVGGGVLGSAVVEKDTNKEEFDLLYKTFREFKALLVKEQRKLSDINNGVGLSAFGSSSSLMELIKKGKLKKQQKIVDDIESDLNDYEQRILDLGYSATSRGTFYKR